MWHVGCASLEHHYETRLLAHVARICLRKTAARHDKQSVSLRHNSGNILNMVCHEQLSAMFSAMHNMRGLSRAQSCELLCPLLRDTMDSCAGKRATPRLSHAPTQRHRGNGGVALEQIGDCIYDMCFTFSSCQGNASWHQLSDRHPGQKQLCAAAAGTTCQVVRVSMPSTHVGVSHRTYTMFADTHSRATGSVQFSQKLLLQHMNGTPWHQTL